MSTGLLYLIDYKSSYPIFNLSNEEGVNDYKNWMKEEFEKGKLIYTGLFDDKMSRTIFYPKSLEDIKDGDIYQRKFPMSNSWGKQYTFSNNICKTKRDSFKYLIEQKQIRVLRDAETRRNESS